MKHVWLVIFALGCHSASQDTCTECEDGGSGSGSGGLGGGSGSDGAGGHCEVTTTPGPAGRLIDYQVTDDAEWILTATDDGRTTLLEDTGTGWRSRSLGAACFDGVMTIAPSGQPSVACLVRDTAAQKYDLRVFEVGPTQATSTLVFEGEAGANPYNALPHTILLDDLNRPTVLWQGASGTDTSVFGGTSGLFRKESGVWDLVTYYEYSHLDATAALYRVGGELRVVYPDSYLGSVVIARPASQLMTVAEVSGADAGLGVAGGPNALQVTTIDVDGTLRYRKVDGTGVASPRVIGHGVAFHSSISLDADGSPVIVYGSDVDGFCITRASSAWNTIQIDPEPGVRALARFTPDGETRVAFTREEAGTIEILREQCAP